MRARLPSSQRGVRSRRRSSRTGPTVLHRHGGRRAAVQVRRDGEERGGGEREQHDREECLRAHAAGRPAVLPAAGIPRPPASCPRRAVPVRSGGDLTMVPRTAAQVDTGRLVRPRWSGLWRSFRRKRRGPGLDGRRHGLAARRRLLDRQRQQMVLARLGERVRPGDLAPAPPAGPLQQRGDGDLLVRQAGAAVRVAVDVRPAQVRTSRSGALEVTVQPVADAARSGASSGRPVVHRPRSPTCRRSHHGCPGRPGAAGAADATAWTAVKS